MKQRKLNWLASLLLSICMIFSSVQMAMATNEEPSQVQETVSENYNVTGVVRDINDVRLSNIKVTLWQNDTKVKEVTTNSEGEYSITSIEPGTYTVKAGGETNGLYYEEDSDIITISNQNVKYSFNLEEGNLPGTYSIFGSISTVNMDNLYAMKVTLWQGNVKIRELYTHFYGKYSFTSLEPGTYTVKAGGNPLTVLLMLKKAKRLLSKIKIKSVI